MATATDFDIAQAIAKLQNYASIATPDELDDLYSTFGFADLCVARMGIDQADLTEEQQTAVAQADQILKSSFTPAILKLYADYFPSFPIREWWG